MITFKPISLEDFIKPYNPSAPTQEMISSFSQSLQDFLAKAQSQSDEEFQKNEINKFLRLIYGYDCNTKGRIDSAIYVDGEAQVLIEVKALANKNELLNPLTIPLAKPFVNLSCIFCVRSSKETTTPSSISSSAILVSFLSLMPKSFFCLLKIKLSKSSIKIAMTKRE